MPIFEYECGDCRQVFEKLVLTPAAGEEVACPGCGSGRVARRFSTFSARSGGGAASSPEDGGSGRRGASGGGCCSPGSCGCG